MPDGASPRRPGARTDTISWWHGEHLTSVIKAFVFGVHQLYADWEWIVQNLMFATEERAAQAGHMPWVRAPRRIPPSLAARFTLNGSVPVQDAYQVRIASHLSLLRRSASHRIWLPLRSGTDTDRDHSGSTLCLLSHAQDDGVTTFYEDFSREKIDELIRKASSGEPGPHYEKTDVELHAVLKAEIVNLKGKRVFIGGSLTPWYESVALHYGAASVVTVEYNPLRWDHDQITTFTPDAFAALWETEQGRAK